MTNKDPYNIFDRDSANGRYNVTTSEKERDGLIDYNLPVYDKDGLALWFKREQDRAVFLETFKEWAEVNGSPVQFHIGQE
jgi:hypothetical protein